MKFLFGAASLLLFVFGTPRLQQPIDSCHFNVSDSTSKPTITGPVEITSLVHVVEQPDSPVQILSIDFTGYTLSVDHERFTFKDCWTAKVHNRSDEPVDSLDVMALVSSKGFGAGPASSSGSTLVRSLTAGEEAEIRSCNGGGSGDARGNQVRIFAFVERVDMGKCVYLPSKRIPFDLAGPMISPRFHRAS